MQTRQAQTSLTAAHAPTATGAAPDAGPSTPLETAKPLSPPYTPLTAHHQKRHTEARAAPKLWPSDLHYLPSFTNHQEFLKKSPGAQSYDLERDRHPVSAPTASTRMRLWSQTAQSVHLRASIFVRKTSLWTHSLLGDSEISFVQKNSRGGFRTLPY